MQEKSILIKNARIVNEGKIIEGDVLIENQFITEISESISAKNGDTQVIDAENKFLLPGMIDDQVHFREPGLTHKANIATESKAAIEAGLLPLSKCPIPFLRPLLLKN